MKVSQQSKDKVVHAKFKSVVAGPYNQSQKLQLVKTRKKTFILKQISAKHKIQQFEIPHVLKTVGLLLFSSATEVID